MPFVGIGTVHKKEKTMLLHHGWSWSWCPLVGDNSDDFLTTLRLPYVEIQNKLLQHQEWQHGNRKAFLVIATTNFAIKWKKNANRGLLVWCQKYEFIIKSVLVLIAIHIISDFCIWKVQCPCTVHTAMERVIEQIVIETREEMALDHVFVNISRMNRPEN